MNDRALVIGRWSYVVLATILPIVSMMTCNVLTVAKIKTSQLRGVSGPEVRIGGMTAMLLSVCAVFVITTLPVKVVMIKMKMLAALYGCCFMANIILSPLFLFQFSNYAINFLLYCATGSNIREELKIMFCPNSGRAATKVAVPQQQAQSPCPRRTPPSRLYVIQGESAQ
jgi:hypothetical protein